MTSRRGFLKRSAVVAASGLGIAGCGSTTLRERSQVNEETGESVNDVHSQLNPTRVSSISRPKDFDSLQKMLRDARRADQPVSICGGRHAGGGQQFLSDRRLIDLSDMRQLIHLDQQRGFVEIEAGARWPGLIDQLHQTQLGRPANSIEWGIHQKQGGADELSLAGALASNVHGRDLNSRPIIQDIESFILIDPEGNVVPCSRTQNPERFRLVVGGYGLFGVVYSVILRLAPRRKLIKRILWTSADRAVGMLEEHAASGAVHGDFQFSVNEQADDFLREGLLSWYEPALPDAAIRKYSPEEAVSQFNRLVALAHRDKSAAMAVYRQAMLATDGEVDWSDSWQSGDYVPNYHRAIDDRSEGPGSEILSEIYVPRTALQTFLSGSARVLREHNADLIYGTVRMIREDDETFLAWAKQDYACVIFNLHTLLKPDAISKNAQTFQALLDVAIALNGSYYLTYHRFARKDQVLSCYPQMPKFLAAKQQADPKQRLQSDWYRFYRDLLA